MFDATFENARVLGPEGLSSEPLSVAGGVITDGPAGRAIDLTGFMILPGIVDLHGDGFESHLAPRRGALKDLGAGLSALDAELGANGITTAVLAQFFSWEGGMRSPDFAERLVDALAGFAARTDMRLQLRLETHLLDEFARAEALIDRGRIGYVVFNDHLPHKHLAAGKRPPRLTGQALKSGRSPEAHHALLQALHDRGRDVPAALSALARRLSTRGVLLGSHDDCAPARRAQYRDMGATVSEFPESQETALAACRAGDPVILGAPNVVRGGSHSGKVSAAELVGAGACDALVSDYHYPSIHNAALLLAEDIGLPAAWRLVSQNPAQILGLSDRGALRRGLRADLVIVDAQTGRIGATLCGGRITFAAGETAERFFR